ncbi:LysR family transcriptional regulator [Burkholderia territorii]|uniref:LysR family transcriptional regulator n=1 Tax=Burkholderia territorii TaxID=1503055 RepID=UPI0009BD317D|nr:LysR family transcriptional regulator [Burkholderia territorii]
MDTLETLEALIAAADAGTFAAAGRHLGKSRDYVSKAVTELEERLGSVLFYRTTRRTVLTEVGEAYIREIRPLVEGLRAADRRSVGHSGTCGKVVLNAPLMWGMAVLSPHISDYLRSNPDVEVEVRLTDEMLVHPSAETDITLRLSASVDPDLNAELLGEVRRVVCAAPAYLMGRDEITSPQSLAKHDCLLYGNLATGSVWVLRRGREIRKVPVRGKFSCNNGAMLAAVAASGCGVVTLPEFVAAPYVADGRLVTVLQGWEPLPLSLHAIVPPERLGFKRVQSLLSYLRQQI